MRILTRDFDEMEIQEQDIVTFVSPIYGFEDRRNFVLLVQEEIGEHFAWLQSTEDPSLCFMLADPAVVCSDYRPLLPTGTGELLGEGDYMCWLMLVVKEDFGASTVNLKSPVVVNPSLRRAAQIILENDYPLRHPLMQQKGVDV